MKRYSVNDLELTVGTNPLFQTDSKEEADEVYKALRTFARAYGISSNLSSLCVVDNQTQEILY